MGSTIVKIGMDRILNVNGNSFFPIGARHIPDGATLEMLNDIGFNCVRWVAFGTDSVRSDSFDFPEELNGLMFYPYIFNRADFSKDREIRQKNLKDFILKIKDHPALLCYEQRNEPSWVFRDFATPKTTPEGLMEGSNVIRELDKNHPIRIGHGLCNLVSTLKKYNAAADIVGCNPYVIVPYGMRPNNATRIDGRVSDSPNQTLSLVGDYTTKMMNVAEGRPVWMQLQSMPNENWHSRKHTPEQKEQGLYEYHKLYPSYFEMRFMVFNAIVRGATGIEWSLYRVSVKDTGWMDVCKIISELHELHDILGAPVWHGKVDIEYRELGFSDWTGIETLVKLHNEKPCIIAVNTQFDPMEATFSNLPEGFDGKLNVFSENRELNVKDGRFTDWFQPYAVHVYFVR